MSTIPGFTAGLSAYPARSHYVVAARSGAQTPGNGVVVPQQGCQDTHGPCTGIWPWYHGEQCVVGRSGAEQCCTTAGMWPYIRECPTTGGGWRVSRQTCLGPCA
jgi:hypothetical protein